MDEISEKKLIRFANTISGHYSNFSQAQNNSKDFAHINIYFIPISRDIVDGPSLYSEQSFAHDRWSPYRQAVIKILLKNNLLILESYKLANAERVAGAGINSELLIDINREKLSIRNGCSMYFKEIKRGYYMGNIEPGENCLIKREGRLTYLESNVQLFDNKWISKDEGFDLKTKEKVWGSKYGPFLFEKVKSLNQEINRTWLYGKKDI